MLRLSHHENGCNQCSDHHSRCMVTGGEPVGNRLKWWHFVSSRPERIEQAKQDWRDQKFG